MGEKTVRGGERSEVLPDKSQDRKPVLSVLTVFGPPVQQPPQQTFGRGEAVVHAPDRAASDRQKAARRGRRSYRERKAGKRWLGFYADLDAAQAMLDDTDWPDGELVERIAAWFDATVRQWKLKRRK